MTRPVMDPSCSEHRQWPREAGAPAQGGHVGGPVADLDQRITELEDLVVVMAGVIEALLGHTKCPRPATKSWRPRTIEECLG